MIKCGNRNRHGDFNTYHVSVTDVKACFAGRIVDSTSVNIDLEARAAAEGAQLAPEPASTGPRVSDTPVAVRREILSRMAAQVGGEFVPTEQRETSHWSEQVPAATATVNAKRHFFGRQGDATGAQISFINRLLAERVVDQLPLGWVVELEDRILTEDLGKRDASEAISKLLAQPKKVAEAKKADAPAAPQYATVDGIYRNPETGEIFKLQFNRAHGDGRHLYAKRLVLTNGDWDEGAMFEVTNIPLGDDPKSQGQAQAGKLEWRYVGAVAKAGVLPAWLLTRDEAAAFGALYGVCVRCHRDLTKEESIDRAMGPICAGKMGW